ncbi:MAG: hypothetical protein SPH43_03765, partial [Candidatus Enteromonas sp.]|nr:hypothetical protein [Candidatus Enteromonas sp.]
MKMMKNPKVRLLMLPSLTLMGLVSCGGQKEHVHEFETHEEVFPTCCEEGTEAYQTCSGCDKFFDMTGKEIKTPVKTPLDANNHKGAKELTISGSFQTHYCVGDTFDMEHAEFAVKCEFCQGTVLSDAKKAKIQYSYPTAGATCFTVGDLASQDLKMTFTYSDLTVQTNVTLSKKENVIEGLEPLEKVCGFKPFSSLEGVTSTFGEIVYTFADSESGEYKTAEQLGADYSFLNAPASSDPKVFYVKATVQEGEDYNGVEANTTLTIRHNDASWNTESEEYDVFGCVCQEPIKFNKKIVDNQDVDLNATAKITLTGTSFDAAKDTVKSIRYEVNETTSYDLGTDLNNLDVAALKEHKEHHGVGALKVVVTTPKDGIVPEFDHEIKVPVTMATALIYDNDETFSLIKPVRSSDPDHVVTGYYKLMENISHDVYKAENFLGVPWIGGWKNDVNHYAFKGTLDGNGKTITGQGNYSYGLFCQLEGATVKNLTFNDIWFNGTNNCP